MTYVWKVEKISDTEWVVRELHPMDDYDKPWWILARCSGPVPAGRIMEAMELEQRLTTQLDAVQTRLRQATAEIANLRDKKEGKI